MNINQRHFKTDRMFVLMSIIFLFTFMLAPSVTKVNADTADVELANPYRNMTAGFVISLPSTVVLKNESPGRVVWNYSPGEDLNITLRLNYIYIGVNINPDEYMMILFDSKKNENIEPQWQQVNGGKGFTYEVRSGKTDDDLVNLYLVAISERGWLCTTTVMGKWSVMKKELKLFKKIFDSFEYVSKPAK